MGSVRGFVLSAVREEIFMAASVLPKAIIAISCTGGFPQRRYMPGSASHGAGHRI